MRFIPLSFARTLPPHREVRVGRVEHALLKRHVRRHGKFGRSLLKALREESR